MESVGIASKANTPEMTGSLYPHQPPEVFIIIMITDSAKELKRFLVLSSLNDFAHSLVLRMMPAFMWHRGRMSCSQAGGAIRTAPGPSRTDHAVPGQTPLAERRLPRWRVGPTRKPDLKIVTPDDVKILMTGATRNERE